MKLVEKKSINRIKRSADQISSIGDIIALGSDNLLSVAKKIFFEQYQSELIDLSLSLFHTRAYQHQSYPNIKVIPHFIRDDGVIIYLEIYQNDLPIMQVSTDVIHLTMEILKIKTTQVYSIELKPKININTMHKMTAKTLQTSFSSITNTEIKYSSKITKEYLSTLVKKKFKSNNMNFAELDPLGLLPLPNQNTNTNKTKNSRKFNKPNKVNKSTKTNTVVSPVKGFHYPDWVSATKTRNYALSDTLVDWLDNYGKTHVNQFISHKPDEPDELIEEVESVELIEVESIESESESDDLDMEIYSDLSSAPIIDTNDFPKFIMNKGLHFESDVIRLIRSKIDPTEFIAICTSMKDFSIKIPKYETKTIQAMKSGIPVIYQPLLLNRSGPLVYSYGMPDLLVRSDYVRRFIDLDPFDKAEKSKPALKINAKTYHYVIIDIKFTTLELCSDGERIRNSGNFPAYKCQLYVYNSALGLIQGYEPPTSYILGRKYKYESSGVNFYGNSCFDRLGHIKYNSWDNTYVDETVGAIRWIKKLRSEGSKWKLYPTPSVDELYPNMCVNADSPWNSFKETYANKIGEITLLWNCGIGNRMIAHDNGIYSYRDKDCKSSKIGITGQQRAPVVDAIISINQTKRFKTNLDKIHINWNPQVDNSWIDEANPIKKKSYRLQLSIDFETINNIFDNFKQLPEASNSSHLFMIGLSYKIADTDTPFSTQQAKYKMFLLSELTVDAEFQMILQFYNFIRELSDKYLGTRSNIPRLYHWGHIERSVFEELCSKIRRTIGSDVRKDLKRIQSNLTFYDLSECFKRNPIVINGCFKFGLKEISKRLYELNLIKTTWKKDTMCIHGNAAMILSHKAYEQSNKTGIPIIKIPVMKSIMEYNQIDCLVIHDIIDLLIKKTESEKLF